MSNKLLQTLIFSALLLWGCSTPIPTATSPAAPTLEGYPAPTNQAQGYPELDVTAVPFSTPIPGAVPLRIDRPVEVGATVVSGSGPAGLVIRIVNVTMMGTELGSGTIGSNGRFSIPVEALSPSVRIGIEISDVGSTGQVYEHYFAPDYQGSEALMIPQVGYFPDTALVSTP